MSFCPTVSVYIGGSIADITYFRNALPETLLFESVALVLLYGGCSRSEYLLQRHGAERFDFLVSPERIPNSEEGLKFLESCSELPVVADLTAMAVYCSEGALSEEELASLPSLSESAAFRALSSPYWEDHFFRLFSRGKIDLSQVDRRRALSLFRDCPEAMRFLSANTRSALAECA